MAITIANNASLVMQGIAIGRFHGTGGDTANAGTITNLTPAASSTPLFDTQMTISAGGASTLQFNDVNHNFGEFYAGSGDTLSVLTSQGGNVQTAHALYNYGLIEAGAGGNVEISVANATTSGDTVNFYNDGWLMANGGTLSANSGILDGANTANPAGTADGYIEIMNKGVANLLGSVAAKEEVIFAGTVTGNTLIVDASNGFAGTVAGFSPGNTIAVAGFSGTANLTTAVSGGDTVLSTKIGSVTDNITLVGTSNPFFDVSTVTVGSITSEVINTDAANYTYAPSGGSTDGYNGANYVGGAAPGSTIHAGENITIASGTAQFGGTPDSPANGTLTDNGTIDVTGSGSVAGTLIAAEPIAGNGS
ncbi:MAG TPA: hypothetical protein PLI12_10860, partial [Acetobacteraceae bacterium]|nr:hypothetical protein [Acetobacteraceae bacterium]